MKPKRNLITRIRKSMKPNVIELKTLGIRTTDPYHAFRDDGFVDDIEEHVKKICLANGEDYEKTRQEHIDKYVGVNPTGRLSIGRSLLVKTSKKCLYFIFYINQHNEICNISNKSHEETHVIHDIGKLNLLEDKIKNTLPNFGFGRLLNGDLCNQNEKEYVAAIGSCYVLHKRGLDLSEGKYTEGYDVSKKAFDDYERLLNGENVKIGV